MEPLTFIVSSNILRRAAALPVNPVTRFAPSPTGYLHLGHVVNALYVWGVAGRLDGTVRLRVEDHDRIRSRTEYEAALLEDLDWLGFQPTADAGAREPIVRQQDRGAIYDDALARLRACYEVYACDCSRSQIGGERYPGRCRDRALSEGAGRGLRVRMAPGVERFDDLVLGPIEHTPADQCGDLLLRDRDGHWTYQFAVTVDDLLQGVTLVIRGADLVASTGRQIRLARMLAESGLATWHPVTYLHHPLILGDDGKKLSKSTGAAGVRSMRHRGLSSEEVIGAAAAAVDLWPAGDPLMARHADTLFDEPIPDADRRNPR